MRTFIAKTTDDFSKLTEISQFRQQKFTNAKQNNAKKLSLTSSLLLKKALSTVNFDEKNALYTTNEHGCPKIENIDNFEFSLSHSGEFAVCSFGKSEVGCDIELVDADFNIKIARRFFTPLEAEFIEKSENKVIDFYRIWTAKEAVSKLFKRGFAMKFSSFSVLTDNLPFIIAYNKKLYIKHKFIYNYCVCVASCENNICEIEEIEV